MTYGDCLREAAWRLGIRKEKIAKEAPPTPTHDKLVVRPGTEQKWIYRLEKLLKSRRKDREQLWRETHTALVLDSEAYAAEQN